MLRKVEEDTHKPIKIYTAVTFGKDTKKKALALSAKF